MARSRRSVGAGRQRAVASVSTKLTPAHSLRQALEWFTRNSSFADLPRHGNVGWDVPQLINLTVLWVWSEQCTLTGAFSHAARLASDLFGTVAVSTYQGLCGALQKYSDPIRAQLDSQLHALMEKSAGGHWRIGKWLAMAVDGSRVTVPRTTSNERAFAAQDYGSGATARSKKNRKNKQRRSKKLSTPVKPQIWLTLIWHMGLKMPWCWKTGPSTASERHHFQELLESGDFPENTLFCGDAGFVGYDLWTTISDRGHSFLMRVGGNVRLLRNLGAARQRNGLVHLWPNQAMKKRCPPLVLRLIELQGPRGKICLVTNILSERELSARQAGQLYRLRWGIELQFRTLKQTFGRTKLRSRTAENARIELDWSLSGLWMIQLYAVREQIRLDHPPEHSSVALALRVFRQTMQNWNDPSAKGVALRRQLGGAVQDQYKRLGSKQARYRPAFKDKPSATRPKVIQASRQQQRAYSQLQSAA